MPELYNLFWSAIRGESLDEFLHFIGELKSSNTLKERLSAYSPKSGIEPADLKSIVRSTPIQYRFLAFLEELTSALIIELINLEPYIPSECSSLGGFLQERIRDVAELTRDLRQEAMEYKLSWNETWKAESLTKSYLMIGNEMLKACRLVS